MGTEKPAAEPVVVPTLEEWTDHTGAAELIGCSRQTIYDLVNRKALTRRYVGPYPLFYIPQCREVAGLPARKWGER